MIYDKVTKHKQAGYIHVCTATGAWTGSLTVSKYNRKRNENNKHLFSLVRVRIQMRTNYKPTVHHTLGCFQ